MHIPTHQSYSHLSFTLSGNGAMFTADFACLSTIASLSSSQVMYTTQDTHIPVGLIQRDKAIRLPSQRAIERMSGTPRRAPVASMEDDLLAEAVAKYHPEIPFRAKKGYVHHTWAKTFFSRPDRYFQPASIQELSKIILVAHTQRRRVVTVGSGHSPSDLTCTSSWLVNLDKMNRILDFNKETGVVKVQAGIRLHDLGIELEKHGLMLPNLGSIDEQSVAGVISTGSHGSSLKYGLLSGCIEGLSIMLASGDVVYCDANNNQDLFRAALLSLGALGVLVEITLKAVPAFNIEWHQSLKALSYIISKWDSGLWTSSEYVRVWWMPYSKRAVLWHADKTDKPLREPPSSWYGGFIGHHVYNNLLYLGNWFPRILPWVEWFVFGMQYGFKTDKVVTTAVQPARTGLLMDCLYSQFVNEWAIPLEKGPEALTRLSAWFEGDMDTAQIPFSSKGVYVHCPIEVRVSDTSATKGPRPFLDPSCRDGPTLYLNATLYRPYNRDPPSVARYYEAFEWLMKEMGGKPHWAKNFETSRDDLYQMYGSDLEQFVRVRNEVDKDGMFLGPWHRRKLLAKDTDFFKNEECEVRRRKTFRSGGGHGVEVDYDPITSWHDVRAVESSW
ncbi:D-arabinono-1,4-lactone oxidase [Ascosphaera aggregata]|nr:D-arabinono-1,4-lactone oxidase [Ascosphaera aggregata]